MLFMGTEKFPDENEYSKYLSEHGGSSNAFTDTEDTNYYFDVNSEHYAGAVTRFAQFFVAPLFTDSATARETLAVNSENSKNFQNDFWRSFQVSTFARRGVAWPAHTHTRTHTHTHTHTHKHKHKHNHKHKHMHEWPCSHLPPLCSPVYGTPHITSHPFIRPCMAHLILWPTPLFTRVFPADEEYGAPGPPLLQVRHRQL